ncbi:hypothetical protein Hdeb2414_s0010g00357181 [Helianthus debilis subsp. tardiflorus]
MGKGHFENRGESAIADNRQQTDTSIDIDTDDKNQFNSVQNGGQVVVDLTEGSMGKIGAQKILGNHLKPLTDQQLMGICTLQQSSQQAEDALSQGMEALQQSLGGVYELG